MSKSTGEKIAAYLKGNGIKQNFIAKKIGVKENTLSSILKGQTKLSIERLELICGVLEKEPNDFIEARTLDRIEDD